MSTVHPIIQKLTAPFIHEAFGPNGFDGAKDNLDIYLSKWFLETGPKAIEYYKRTVMPHKVAVYNAGKKLADNPWFRGFTEMPAYNWLVQLMIHDLSKFSVEEANGYAYYDFDNRTANGDTAKENLAASWLHHKNHNPHHPEYWMNAGRNGMASPLEMPARYVAEMVADWMGGEATYPQTFEQFVSANLETFLFHENTAKKLAFLLGELGFDIYNHGKNLSLK